MSSSKKCFKSEKCKYSQIEFKVIKDKSENSNIRFRRDSGGEEKLLDDHPHLDLPSSQQTCISARLLLAFLSFAACFVLYISRINITVAIVAMSNQTDHHQLDPEKQILELPACSPQYLYLSANKSQQMPIKPISSAFNVIPEFDWSQETQGIIIGSFYWGYIWFQVIGGRMAELFGAKWFIGISILLGGLINLATPVIARTSLHLFIASRFILGLAQSCVWPSFYAMFIPWFSDTEKSMFIAWLDSGSSIGLVVSSAGSGELIKTGFMGGWPSVFYVSGISCIIWFIAWALFVTDDPRKHPWMSKKELAEIVANTCAPKKPKNRRPVPWCQIFTSSAFITILISRYLLGFASSLIMLKLPTYLRDVVDFPIDQNGFVNGLINGIVVPSMFGGGYLASFLIRKTQISKTNVRKMFQAVAGFSFATSLALIPSAGCDKIQVILILTIGLFMVGFSSGGDIPIVADLTNEYPATVFGVLNGIGNTAGFLSPYLIGLMVNDNPYSMQLWSNVFYLSSCLTMLGTLVFVLFADATNQNWGNENDEIENDETEDEQ